MGDFEITLKVREIGRRLRREREFKYYDDDKSGVSLDSASSVYPFTPGGYSGRRSEYLG
jgi:hypothetical protein